MEMNPNPDRSTVNYEPTAEQQKAIDLFATGKDLAIEAGAGTGKTSTLLMLAEQAGPDRRGQYLAFNKAIVTEAQSKFPANVAANTAHSLAYRAIGKQYAHRLRSSRRMKSTELAKAIGVTPFTVEVDGSRKSLTAGFLAGTVMATIIRFCQSADERPSTRHVPYQDGLDSPTDDGSRTYANNNLLAAHILPAVDRAWADLMRVDGVLPYRHDHYLKAWQLSDPFIPADYILFDEAQDANPVIAAIVAAQDHAQRVYVGDTQQQIYAFTGAVNALAAVAADHRAFLSKSFRFGPAIAGTANVVLDDLGADLRIVGHDPIPSKVGTVDKPDAWLFRTNAKSVHRVMDLIREGERPHLVGGGREVVAFARAADELREQGRTSHRELACFESWGEVQDYVENDPQGSELKLMVGLIDEFGTDSILEALDRMPSEKNATVIVSTAHKSKGREWDAVALGSDFPDPNDEKRKARLGGDGALSPEDLRLLYVSVTRAKLTLDVSAVGYFTGKLGAEAAA